MKKKLIIIGAGGHAKVIIDILNTSKEYEIIGCLDNDSEKKILGVPVIGKDDDLQNILTDGINHAFVALGDNKLRKQINEKLLQMGFKIVNVISSNAIISEYAKLGNGVAIMPGAIVNADATIGDGVIVNTSATVDHDCIIGDYAHIAPGCNISGKVSIGEGTFIGVGSRVIDGITIGRWVMIGSGAAVVKNICDNCTAVGVPAKIIKYNDEVDNMSDIKKISIANPVFNGNEKVYLNECIDTGWISANGKFVTQFENEFAKFCGVDYALTCSNGTVSLHLALLALGIKPGDEVIIPTLTYIATANVVRYCGATPVFVDSEKDTWNIDTDRIEEKITKNTKAIMPTHLYGHSANMDPILKIAEKYGLYVIEDAAEAHGATYKGRKVGSIGDVGSFSFFGNKIITTGEGGMVTTNNKELYNKMKMLRSQGMDPNKRYWHTIIGYNYRMTNMQAAVGLAQLENVEWHLEQRKRIADLYIENLKELSDYVEIPKEMDWGKHVYWMFSIILKDNVKIDRDELRILLDQQGIETRPLFYPMHTMPPYFKENGDYPIANYLGSRGINLPSHALLKDEDIKNISSCIREVIVNNI